MQPSFAYIFVDNLFGILFKFQFVGMLLENIDQAMIGWVCVNAANDRVGELYGQATTFAEQTFPSVKSSKKHFSLA